MKCIRLHSGRDALLRVRRCAVFGILAVSCGHLRAERAPYIAEVPQVDANYKCREGQTYLGDGVKLVNGAELDEKCNIVQPVGKDGKYVRVGKATGYGETRDLTWGEKAYDVVVNPDYTPKSLKETRKSYRKHGIKWGEDEQKQLKALGDDGSSPYPPSFNPSVDAWRSDEDIAKAAIWYAGGKDWKDYVKILDARIGYLEQVLTDGKGDASFANWQTEEMIKIDVRIYKTVSNAEGWSQKDSARVLQKMIEDYAIKDKLRRLLNLLEEVEKRGIWSKRVGGEFSDSSPNEKPMRDKQQGVRSDNHSCSCKNPSPNVTVGGRTGWASCDKCNKLIGAVTVDKNGEVHVAGRNQVANEMVKDMVKKTLTKDKSK